MQHRLYRAAKLTGILTLSTVLCGGIASAQSPVYSIVLEIDGIGAGQIAFTYCTPLESRSEVLETYTANSLFPDKEPGLVSYGRFTCNKPLDRTTFQDFSLWRRTVEEGNVNRRGVSYILLDLNQGGTEVLRFNLFEAWPSAYGVECEVGHVCTENLTIAFERMQLG